MVEHDWTTSPARLLDAGSLLTRALSDGRREAVGLDTGTRRAFGTDLRRVFVPWPLPASGLGRRRLCTVGLALQASPTKELAACLVGAGLDRAFRRALTLCEGRAALGWAIRRWPGLAADLRSSLPGLDPEDPPETPEELLARVERAGRRPAAPPALVGSLRVTPTVRRWSTTRGKPGRLPWSSRDIRSHLAFVESVPVGGSGGYRNLDGRPPIGPDDDDPDQVHDEHTGGIPYREWDVVRGRYRPDFVTVFEIPWRPTGDTGWRPASDVTGWVRASPERQWAWRLDQGSELDGDAYAERRALEAAGFDHDDRHYAQLQRASRDVATAVLIDASASLGATAGRLMALQLDCAFALSSVMTAAREPHAVYAFSSEGRHRVTLRNLRPFAATEVLRAGHGSLRPGGYTRIGAALRHASARLLDQPARRHVLLAFGDGLPSDEAYEGRYAVADTVRAVEEAADAGVVLGYIAVGKVRNDALGRALGPLLVRVEDRSDLGVVLAGVHERLRR